MNIRVDKSQKIPLYKQIAGQIQAQITSGEIPEGFHFPSERQLADTLGVNRTTVLNAYKELKADGLMVSPVAGFSSLRQAICSYMEKRSCFCKPSEVMVLSGSQQGIDLIARAFLNPGDIVLIEEPSFFPAIQSFRMAGAKLMAVPMEEDGMNMDILEQLLSRYQPKLIYTMPAYHNPCGVSMSMAKRIRLLELANRYSVPILEDDPYSELYYEGEAIAPLKSMDKSGYVIYLSTFSKTISPGLRLGWMCAGKKLIHELVNIRQLVDLHANCISQQIVERFIVSGQMEAYLESIRKEYRDRAKKMADALNRYAPPGLTWNSPAGGYYLWCSLPQGVSAEKLVPEAARNGVAVMPGMPSFLMKAKGDSYIRLNYTFPPKNKIGEGIRILCDAIRKLAAMGQEEETPILNEINPIL